MIRLKIEMSRLSCGSHKKNKIKLIKIDHIAILKGITNGKERKELRRRPEVGLRIGLRDLVKAVEKETGVSADEITGPAETRECSRARDFFAYIARYYSGRKISEIARFLHRSISTITMSLRRMRSRLEKDEASKGRITKIVGSAEI